MKVHPFSRVLLAATTIGLAACESSTSTSPIFDDAAVTADIAATSGEAIADLVVGMMANQDAASLSIAGYANSVPANALTVNRTRTCYNATGAVVQGCSPMSSVRKIVTHVTADGSRSGTRNTTGGATATWSGVAHRVSDDTLTRNFSSGTATPVETSRTHAGITTGNDTTTFTEGTFNRTAREATIDSVRAVTFNLPRSSNPYPVSGSIVRRVSASVVVSNGTRTETRTVTRRVEVTFPADAQGNVVLKINDKTCSLNLVTRTVSNCQ